MGEFKFPKKFYWGAATSAHQVEGNQKNDWTEWEKRNAKRLAKEAKNYWQKWQQEKYPEMLEPENYISGWACDHYHLYEQDFRIAKELNHNAYRFSIEWSRIEPEEGIFNENEIKHYQEVIETLLNFGLEPFVTLCHFTLPLWFAKKGGWLDKKSSEYFERYIKRILPAFKKVKFFITLNEPNIYASNSYSKGLWPPQKRNFFSYQKVLNNFVKVHQRAYLLIKKFNPQVQVGIAKNIVYYEAAENKIVNNLLKKIHRWSFNFRFLNRIKNHQDFIGLNYYFYNRIDFGFSKNENKIVSDLGWEIYPEGIYYAIKSLSKYKKPIFITENGVADKDDKIRAKFIKDHLYWLSKTIKEGFDVRGYFYWSLLDNFEWDKGFWPRFGLVKVDYKTQKRKIKPSALAYANLIKMFMEQSN